MGGSLTWTRTLLVTLLSSVAVTSVSVAATPTITSFAATPSSITPGQSTTLSWSVTNATSVSINEGIGTVASSGTVTVTPTETTKYVLTARGGRARATSSVVVTVQSAPAPTISGFSAAPSSITAGQSSVLSWTVTNATAVTLDGTTVSASGTTTVTPGTTTTYSLTAVNASGSVSRQVEVTVVPPAPPVVSNGQPTGTLAAGTTTAALSVTTNETATCRFSTVAGSAFSAMTPFATTGQTAHSSPLTGLVPGAYTYYVKCSSAQGAVDAADYVVSFTVPTPPAPTSLCPTLPPATGNTITVATTSDLVNAVASAPSGTTILVADGTYTGVDLVFRTPNITLRSESGNRDGVVIDGDYEVGEVLSILAANVTIADLSVSRPQNHPVHLGGGGDHATLYNLHLIDAGEQFVKVNPDTSGDTNDYGTLGCSLLELTPAGRSYVETTTAAATGFACYTGGIDGHAAWGWWVHDNTIRDIYCDSGLAEHAIHFWDSSRDTVVERNVVVNDARGIGFGLGTTSSGRAYPDNPLAGTGISPTAVGHIGGVIRNNFIYADVTAFDTAIGLEEAWSASVFHNTVLSTVGGLGIDLRYTNTTATVENNLATPGLDQRDGGQLVTSGGNFAATASMFVSPSTGDLHLVSAAVALKGVPLDGLVPTDIDGQPRAAVPDSGADEFSPALSQAIARAFQRPGEGRYAGASRVRPNFGAPD
jgi:hypothetical protein